jgi:hypothetical protein
MNFVRRAAIVPEPGVYRYRDTFYPAVESLQGVLEVRK